MFRTGHSRGISSPAWLRRGLVAVALAAVFGLAVEAAGLLDLAALGTGPLLAVSALAVIGGTYAGYVLADRLGDPQPEHEAHVQDAGTTLAPQREEPITLEPSLAEPSSPTFQDRISAERAAERQYARGR